MSHTTQLAPVHPMLHCWPRWLRYSLAVAITLGVFWIRMDFWGNAERPLLILFMLPIIVSACLGGLGAGLLATLISAVGVAYFFPPAGTFAFATTLDLAVWAILIVSGVLVSVLTGILHCLLRRQGVLLEQHQKMQAALRESQERYDLASSVANEAIWETDLNDGTTRWNQTYADMFQRPPEARLDNAWWAGKLHPEDRERVMSSFDQALREGACLWLCDYRMQVADGSYAFIRDRALIVRDGAGKAVKAVGAKLNTTAQMRAEQALRESVKLLRLAQANSGVGIWDWMVEQELLHVSPEFEQLYGVPLGTMHTYQDWVRHIHADDLARIERERDEAIARREPFDLEFRIMHPSGEPRWISAKGKAEYGEAGVVRRVTGTNMDITARKRSEERIKTSEERLRDILDKLAAGVSLIDADGRFTYVNRRAADVLGMEPEVVVGKFLFDVLAPEAAATCLERNRRLLAMKGFEEYEHTFTLPTGTRTFFIVDQALANERGEATALLSSSFEITGRKQAEAELLTLKNRLESELVAMTRLHDISTRFVVDGDKQSFLDHSLAAAVEIAGADMGIIRIMDEVASKSRIVAHVGFGSEFSDCFKQQACHTCINSMERGERIFVEDVAESPLFAGTAELEAAMAAGVRAAESTPLFARSGRLLGILCTHFRVPRVPQQSDLRFLDLLARQLADLIDRSQAEEALLASEERLRLAKRAAGLGIYDIKSDALHTTLDWDEQVREFWGVGPEEPITPETFMAGIHPNDRGAVQAALDRALDPAGDGEYYAEYRVVSRTRGNMRHVAATGQAFFEQNRAVRLVGTVQDISVRKRTELALEAYKEHLEELVATRTADLEAARNEAQNLERIKSDFIANMSHEIRTPLNAVLGFAQIGQRDSKGRKIHATFGRILDAGQLLLGIVNDILDFSKIEAGKFSVEHDVIRLGEIIEHTADLVKARAEAKGLGFEVEMGANLPASCRGDGLRLSQVLANLLSNAIKFTERGKVTLSAACSGGTLVLRVTDTGIGMSPLELSRLFRPFEQADGSITRKFGGTGLGLVISKRLVELMGGDIRVESQPGLGSRFEVRLPLVEPAGLVAEGDEASPLLIVHSVEPRLQGLVILAAEDNDVNRLVLEELLAEEGCCLVMAENGRLAVEQVKAVGADGFDLVLMDIQMPEMDGYEATRRIHEVAPGLPVVGLSAHALSKAREECLAAGMVDQVIKPIDLDALIAVILQHVRYSGPA